MTARTDWLSILCAVAIGGLLVLWSPTGRGDEELTPQPAVTLDPTGAEDSAAPSKDEEAASDQPQNDTDAVVPATTEEPGPPREPVTREAMVEETAEKEVTVSDAATNNAPAGQGADSGAAGSRVLPESFDRLRPVFFFQGQASGLVPDSFRPLAMSQLDRQLRAQRGLSLSAFEKPQLLRAVYVARLIDSSLVSSQSTWEIAYSGGTPTRMVLGKIGMALQSAMTLGGPNVSTAADASPVVTDPEGKVSVAVAGDTRLSLAWTAAGRESEREVLFDIAIPKAGQARWLIAVPQGHQVQALDGVGRALPSPPPEAGTRDLGRGISWFAIEAGGLSRIRLRILKFSPDGPEEAAVIRQASVQYDLGPALIRFTSRLILDARTDGLLPPLQVDGGRITSVSLNGASANWTETSTGSSRILRIEGGRPETTTAGAFHLTIDGEAAWGNRPGSQKLPWLQLRDCVPILIGNEMQIKVLIDSRLRIPRLELPPNWRYTSPLEADERRTTYLLGGPWGNDAPVVRAVPDPGQIFADSLLRLSASETRLRAVAEMSIPLAMLGPQPIRLRIEPSWTPEVVLLPQSGRVVDLPQEVAARRNVTIWPTADELKNGNLIVRVVGSQPLPSEGDFARYPSTSFLSISNCRNRFAAVVTPPPGFRWTADASLRTHRITLDQLSPVQREMLGELPPDALLLDISQSKVAALGSRRPAAAFRASSVLRLALENNRLVETYFVKCESASGGLNQVRIEFSPGNRSDIEWSVMDQEHATRRLIRARRMTATPEATSPTALGSLELAEELPSVDPEIAEPREVWELELEQADARSVMLVGRRESAMPSTSDPSDALAGKVRVDLPSVVGASTRLAQVLVEPSLDVHRYSAGVLRVPQLVSSDRLLIGAPAAGSIALRYDSTAATWLELRAVEAAAAVPVLWQELVEIVASGRGGDWITATYSSDPESVLVIDHEPGLRLVSVADQDDARLDYDVNNSRLSVKTLPSSRQVTVQWSRPANSAELWQQWMPPLISTTGVLLRRDWRVTPAPDTLIPDAWSQGGSLRLDPSAPQLLWLVDRSIGLSLIAVVGCLLFGLAWWVSLGSPLVTGIGLAISVLILSGLPLGWLYWIAGVCVPIAAGGLVGTTLSARKLEDRARRNENSIANSQGPRAGRAGVAADLSRTVDGVQERSSRSLLGRIGCWLVIGGTLALSLLPTAGAQELAAESPPPRPTVLIPTKPDGTLAGDKVYISQSLFDELFQGKASATSTPLITSATYRLRLDGMTEAGMPTADWEVRYSLVELGERSELVLPIRSTQVRSIQWLPEGDPKPLRWSPEGETSIRIHLPPGPTADLLLRLASDIEAPQRWVRRIRFKIPAVASASLVVDSSAAVQRFELTEALGQTIAQPEVGRLSAALGAIDAIDLTVMLRQGTRGITAIAARRYWVHASEKGCQIECEVEPGEENLRRGSDVPIVILGGSAPILTSADWAVHASEMVSPRRQLLTLRALRDGPEPIRLLWQVDATVVGGNDEGTTAVVIPDVISAGSANTPEAWIALHAAEGLRLVAQPSLTAASDSADAVDAFVASWKGYRGTAQQVIRSPSPLTRLALIEAPARPWTAAEMHHLHIRPGELRLTYDATITRGERSLGPLRAALPLGSDIREITLNGQPVSAAPQRIGNRLEIALPDPAGQEKLLLRVVTHQRAPTTETFQPPRIRVEPIHQVTGSYSLTRNHALWVEQVTATELPEIGTPPLDIADQLLSSWIPCWTWRIDEQANGSTAISDRPTELPGEFRIEPQSTNLDVLQKTAVRWRQSRWMMEAVIRVQRRNAAGDELPLLDDINIELPTAWSDQLQVEPAEAWSSQPAIDPAMKVVRIRPDAAARAAGVTTIRIQAMRMNEADALLEVPRVQVLSATTRRSFLVVPQALGGRPLTWKAVAAVADQLPDEIADGGSGSGAAPQPPPPQRSGENQPLVFRALSNTATVQLEPSRSETTVARATVADVQLFPQSRDRWLAILRWDLEPGDRDRVSINVPAGVTPLAVWTAGKPLPLSGQLPRRRGNRAGDAVSDEPIAGEASVIEIPLALSRLAQPLVMLCRLQVDPAGSRPELPTLVDIEVDQTWLSLYQSRLATDEGLIPRVMADTHWQVAQAQERLLTLAQSVLAVTESSISGATDRPQEEVIAWLKPWDERLAKLRSEARRETAEQSLPGSGDLEGEDADDPDELDPTVNEEGSEEQISLPEPWESLGRQWRRYVRRVTSGEASPSTTRSAALMPATHWQVAFVARHTSAAQRLPLLTFHEGSSPVATAIQLLIGMVMVIGVVLLAWRFKRWLAPLLSYPAFWLFAVGVTALAVAPTPVALAILLVAILSPVLSRRPVSTSTVLAPRDASPRRLAERL